MEIKLDSLQQEEEVVTTQGDKPEREVNNKREKAVVDEIVSRYADKVNKGQVDRSKVNTWSECIKVVKSLGFSEEGGLVRASLPAKKDKATGKEPGRKINKVSMIVGYRFRNISDELGKPVTIPYMTEVFEKDAETGKYVGKVVTLELAPGEEVNLTKKYSTILATVPEISCRFANARMVKVIFEGRTLEETLNGAYIKLVGEGAVPVHSAEFKEQIGEPVSTQEIDGKEVTIWKVLDKYEATFGFLNDLPEGGTKKGGSNKPKLGDVRYEAISDQVQQMIAQQGLK